MDVWEPGTTILSTYEVVKGLGMGGMATTHLVRHLHNGTLFALKVPHSFLMQTTNDRALFTREVQLWINLPPHPHIVQCFFVRDVYNLPAVFSEYVPSGTLGSWSKRQRIQSVSHILDLGIQLAEAMEVAEAMGVVHRDLKPSNCLMDDSGLVKISDFGLSSVLEARSNPKDWVRGTQAYCSPEQYDGRSIDISSDIWSFGVTLLELLTERVPLVGPAAFHLVRTCRETDSDEKVPYFLWDFLESLFEEDIERRPRSFATLSQCLRHLYERHTGRVYTREFPAPVLPAQPTTVQRPRVPQDFGKAYLIHALKVTGGNPSAADLYSTVLIEGSRPETATLLTEIAYLKETCHIYHAALEHGPNKEYTMGLFSMFFILAQRHAQLGNLAAAIESSEQAIDLIHNALRQGADEGLASALVQTILNYATFLRQSWQLDEAIKTYDRGLSILQSIHSKVLTPAMENLTACLFNNRAAALYASNRHWDALESIGQAIIIRERLVSLGYRQFTLELAGSYLNRGVFHRNVGKLQSAADDYRRAIIFYEGIGNRIQVAEKDDGIALAYINLAAVHICSKDFSAARDTCAIAITLLEHLLFTCKQESKTVNLTKAYNNMATICHALCDIPAALKHISKCIELREHIVEQRGMQMEAGNLAMAYANKCLFLLGTDASDEAILLAEKAIGWLTHVIEMGHKRLLYHLAKLHVILGALYAKVRKNIEAQKEILHGFNIYNNCLSEVSIDILDDMIDMLALYESFQNQFPKDEHNVLPVARDLLFKVIKSCTPDIKLAPEKTMRLDMLTKTLRS